MDQVNCWYSGSFLVWLWLDRKVAIFLFIVQFIFHLALSMDQKLLFFRSYNVCDYQELVWNTESVVEGGGGFCSFPFSRSILKLLECLTMSAADLFTYKTYTKDLSIYIYKCTIVFLPILTLTSAKVFCKFRWKSLHRNWNYRGLVLMVHSYCKRERGKESEVFSPFPFNLF